MHIRTCIWQFSFLRKKKLLNRIALNQTKWNQTKDCIVKSLCEICTLLRYYTLQSGNSLLTFQDNLSNPKETTVQLKWTLLGLFPPSVFLRGTMLDNPAVFPFNQAKKHLTWLILWTELFSVTWHQRCCNRKMTIEKLKINYTSQK